MRGYWLKILLGAVLIFVVGFTGWTAVRKSVNRVKEFKESSEPISFPLAFIPFNLDGEKAGTFAGIKILRDTPKSITSFHIRVKLGDSVDVEHLKSCRMHLEQTGHDFDPEDGFACVEPGDADSSLVEFGDVTFVVKDGEDFTVPLLLDARTVEELRKQANPDVVAAKAMAESEAAAAKAEAERIKVEVRTNIDRSMAKHRSSTTHKAPIPPATPPQ